LLTVTVFTALELELVVDEVSVVDGVFVKVGADEVTFGLDDDCVDRGIVSDGAEGGAEFDEVVALEVVEAEGRGNGVFK